MKEPTNLDAYAKLASDKLIDDLRTIRKNKGMSQSCYSKIMNTSQPEISRLEKKSISPSIKTFVKCAKALGYDVKLVKEDAYYV